MGKDRASLSPWGDRTAWMAWMSVNSRLCTPSKMFLRKGCTLVGSRVSDRIDRISLFDRKKNLGKTSFRFSRYLGRHK